MLTPLLTTKLYIPPARPDRVSRSRLSEQLDNLRPLTLIVAPAGFGKTTVLSEWIPTCQQRVTWLSLDDDDNDPIRFWIYFIAALQKAAPALGEGALALLQASQAVPINSVLTLLINEVAALTGRLTIVLDDYHVIRTQAIHDGLAFLLDHVPDQLHLILTARADPPLPLARLRSRNLLTDIRAQDLRFTPEEVTRFMNEAMKLKLAPADITALEARTEGWIAGLQLAALSLQGQADSSTFIRVFTGNNRFIVDYLTEEVLSRRPAGTLDFLLTTSILGRLNASLCAAVTGQTGCQAILEELRRANLFLIPLDEERQWYRYHHLFAEVLQSRLKQAHPDLPAQLHRRASEWYARNGFTSEAVHHALATEDWAYAAELLEKTARGMVETVTLAGQAYTLLQWFNALPAAVVRPRPVLCFFYGTVLMFTGQLTLAETWLSNAEAALKTDTPIDETRSVQGWVALIRADIARVRGDLATGVDLARQALVMLPETEALARAVAHMNVAHAYVVDGIVTPAAENIARAAIAPLRTIGNLFATLIAVTNLARLQGVQGRYREAAATFARAEVLAPGGGRLQELLNGAAYHIGLGDLQREWNELAAADRHLRLGLEMVHGALSVDADVVVSGYIAMAKLRLAAGDPIGGSAVLKEFLELARERGYFAPVSARAEAVRAHLWLAGNDLAGATHWAQNCGLRADDGELPYQHELEYLSLARVCLAQGQSGAAVRLLERLRLNAVAAGRMRRVVEILALQAVAHHANQAPVAAFDALDHALTLAEPEGYLRVFVDEGEPMRVLLAALVGRQRQQPWQGYAKRLLAAFSPLPAAPAAARQAQSMSQTLVEPLSLRELEVLQLIAAGLSNQEIAEKLYLSRGTVKVHLRNVYGKLAVKSRTQALLRARELNLL